MQIKIDQSSYSSKFHNILYSWDRYLGAYGGRGSGKTDTFYQKYLVSLFEPFYFKLAYVNKEGSNIRDQQYAGFKRVAKRIGFFDLLKFYDGDYRIVNPANGNMLIPKGMDDPEKTKGMDDLTAIWWDEINKGDYEDFAALNELLRTPQAKYLQFAFSFNPVNENHWLRKVFFHPEDRHKPHPDFKGELLLNRSTYLDNEFIDQKAYLETLLLSAAGNANTIRVNIEGDWGAEENNAPWLFAFNEQKHIKQTIPVLHNGFPIYLSFDFNREPISCIAIQQSPNKGLNDSFVHFVKEFTGDMQLRELCERIRATFPSHVFFVTGDASGSKGDLGFDKRHDTYYNMIQGYLSLTDKQMNLLSRNLEHHDSRNLCNSLLHAYPNIYISREGCPTLINDCIIATCDDKSNKAGQLKKDRDMYKMDMFDAFRYFWQCYFKDYANKMYLNYKPNDLQRQSRV